MKLRDYLLIGFATPLLLSLTAKAAFAFSFKMPASEPDESCEETSTYCSSMSYTKPGFGTVITNVQPVKELPLGGTDNLLLLLSYTVWANNGWSFKPSNRDLDGIFNIKFYAPAASEQSVGAGIHVRYEPEIQDPIGNSVHFIQRMVSNHGVYQSVFDGTIWDQHAMNQDTIYVFTEQMNPLLAGNIINPTFNPFYDTYGIHSRYTNGMIDLLQVEKRPDIFNHHYWYAELFLVEETAPREVTIYNGISWGWENWFIPEEEPEVADSPSCDSGSGGGGSGGGSGGGGCSDNNGWGDDKDDRELPLFDEDDFDEDDFDVDETDTALLPYIALAPCQSQDNAVLPSASDEDWKIFNHAPSTCWFDPPTNYGFEFQALGDTLFTDLLDFPTGIDADDRFTVQVGEEILGEFAPGESVDFVSLLGSGIAEFQILDIDTQENLTDVPFKLGFNETLASFKMRSIAEPEEIPQSIPEPGTVAGILTIGLLGMSGKLRKRK